MDGYDSQWQLTVVYISAIAHHIVILVTYSNMFYSYIMEISLGNLVAYIYGLKHRQGKIYSFSWMMCYYCHIQLENYLI